MSSLGRAWILRASSSLFIFLGGPSTAAVFKKNKFRYIYLQLSETVLVDLSPVEHSTKKRRFKGHLEEEFARTHTQCLYVRTVCDCKCSVPYREHGSLMLTYTI